MDSVGSLVPILLFFFFVSQTSISFGHAHIGYVDFPSDKDNGNVVSKRFTFRNPRLPFQAWKKDAIYSDPYNFTVNWIGSDIGSYINGIVCAPAHDDPTQKIIVGVDLNHADIAGHLPDEIGNLTDVAILHMNSNRFCCIVPITIINLKHLYELDLSNNCFLGSFPKTVLKLLELKYLDLRFNEFEGTVPLELFNMDLDAIFLNNNSFHSGIPTNIGNFHGSVNVISGNMLSGCIPSSVAQMAGKVDEIVLAYNNLSGCLPKEIMMFNTMTVLDLRRNNFVGELPVGMENLESLEVMDLTRNRLRSNVPETMCMLPNLRNLTITGNFFQDVDHACQALLGLIVDDKDNCLADRPGQRLDEECRAKLRKEVVCGGDAANYQLRPTREMSSKVPELLPSPLSAKKSTLPKPNRSRVFASAPLPHIHKPSQPLAPPYSPPPQSVYSPALPISSQLPPLYSRPAPPPPPVAFPPVKLPGKLGGVYPSPPPPMPFPSMELPAKLGGVYPSPPPPMPFPSVELPSKLGGVYPSPPPPMPFPSMELPGKLGGVYPSPPPPMSSH